MISFVRGPGGWRARLGAEFVPFLAGAVAAAFPLTMVSPWLGVLTGLGVWLATSALLRFIRARSRLLRLYRLALLGHVLFWSALGFMQKGREPAGPIELAGASAWPRSTTFRAGYAAAEYSLPPYATLAGWGSRPRRIRAPAFGGFGILGRLSQGWMAAESKDGGPRLPLFRQPEANAVAGHLGARAIVLRPEAEGAPLALVRLDLVTSDAELAHAIHAAVADLGFQPEGVIISATHTHSGPGGYSRSRLSALLGTDHFSAACQTALRAAAVKAIRDAHAAAVPACLTLVRSRDRDASGAPILARRRRGPDPARIDDRVLGLRLSERESGRAIAVLLNYAVHPVILRRRHMAFDRDLAGALERALSERLKGAPVLFVNGAQGDVSPQPGSGRGAARAAELAARFAERIAPDFEAGAPVSRLRLAAVRVRRLQATPAAYAGVGDRGGLVAALDREPGAGGLGGISADCLALPANMLIWSLGLSEIQVGFSWSGAAGARLCLGAGVGPEALEFGALVLELDEAAEGPTRFALLWEPGEATVDLGLAWRRIAAAHGFQDALLLGLTNGSCAYLTTAEEYRGPGYEAAGTVFGPRAGPNASEALESALIRAAALLRDD